MKKTTVIFIASLTLLIGILLGIWGQRSLLGSSYFKTQPGNVEKFDWVIDIIENKYVDKISCDSLLNIAVPYILTQLDPHSEYIAAQDLGAVNESIEGKFDGIGVVFNMATDTAIVLNVITGGPGYKAGIQAGDRIIEVNDSLIAGRKLDQMKVVAQLRGKRGTKVRLGVERGSNKKLIEFSLIRDIIPIASIEANFITDQNSAYVKINSFAENTYIETIEALDRLIKQGATSATIDLRANGGGLLDQALLLANEFLKKGESIVYVQGQHYARAEQRANGNGAFQTIPLYVLIDEASASASEIFAGAMQDNDRATIIGRRSFGKGLIQEQIAFRDGSAARLTVARYYTPLGRPLQKPYSAGDNEKYRNELFERISSEELTTGVNAHVDTSHKFVTAKGRILFGAGGITPDIYVPIDTTELPKYFARLYHNNAIFPFAQRYSDKYRPEINKIKTIKDLTKFFDSKSALYDEFIDYAAYAHKVARPTADEKLKSEELVMAQLRAYIGRNTPLQESAFYFYVQPVDVVAIKTGQTINSDNSAPAKK